MSVVHWIVGRGRKDSFGRNTVSKKIKRFEQIYLISVFFFKTEKNVKPITAVSQKINYTAGNRQFCKAVISHNNTI